MSRLKCFGIWSVVVFSLVLVQLQASLAADAADQPARKAKHAGRPKPEARLPQFYGDIVNEEQKAKIQSIQKDFAPKIKQAQVTINQLRAEEQKAYEAVLTAEQRQKLEAMRASAKAKRGGGGQRRGDRKTAEEKPAQNG